MEKDKNEEFMQNVFMRFCDNIMDQVFLESILLQWASDLQKYHREKLITLHEYIGNPFYITISMNLSLKIIYSKDNIPLLAISKVSENPEFYIFKNDLCVDAFRVVDEMIEESMTEEVLESFYRFFTTALSTEQMFKEKTDGNNSTSYGKHSIN